MRHLLPSLLLFLSSGIRGDINSRNIVKNALCEKNPSFPFCETTNLLKKPTARSSQMEELPIFNSDQFEPTSSAENVPATPTTASGRQEMDSKKTSKMTIWSSIPDKKESKVLCKPDCDERQFPHCSTQCKCDYLLPVVQKYCNPPVPFFMETCRLWSTGCSKLEKFARRATVWPTDAINLENRQSSQSAPPPVLTNGSEKLHLPPPLPENSKRHSPPDEEIDVLEQVSKKKRRRIQSKLRGRARKLFNTPSPQSKRELARGLKAFSSFVGSPVQAAKDLINGQGAFAKARAHAPTSFPVVPSEASYGASSGDPFQGFSGLTDSRGILHRPRSSSPFTKPGLWSANPDDPHNRDHANKYYYRPESVGVDWLNGQLTWGAHWAVPAAQVGGTDGFSAVHFPTIGNFLNIPDDYD